MQICRDAAAVAGKRVSRVKRTRGVLGCDFEAFHKYFPIVTLQAESWRICIQSVAAAAAVAATAAALCCRTAIVAASACSCCSSSYTYPRGCP